MRKEANRIEVEYYNSLPRKRMSAGALFLNADGEVLLVKPCSWFSKTVYRAQSKLFDFGHGIGPVPTLTAEDVILAKLDAGRLRDKDEINSIFESHSDKEFDVKPDLN